MTFLPSSAASASTRAIASASAIGTTLTNPLAVGRERLLDGFLAGRLVGERDERLGVVGLLERTVSEEGDARRPGGAVLDLVLGLELRAERDELTHVRDRGHGARGGESDEALRVQVIAEEQDRVRVTRREE